jgi:hypothetical protein
MPVPQYQEPFVMPDLPSFEMPAMEFPAFPEFPAPYDPSVGEAKKKREGEQATLREIERRRKGYGGTILTGGTGLETDPTLQRPSLLGR